MHYEIEKEKTHFDIFPPNYSTDRTMLLIPYYASTVVQHVLLIPLAVTMVTSCVTDAKKIIIDDFGAANFVILAVILALEQRILSLQIYFMTVP